MQTSVTTIERFIFDQEHRYPEATGELSNLLYDIALAAKIIAAAIRRAGLVNILGTANARNVQGEEQQKLDVIANETIKNCLNHTGRVCVMGSEEDEDIIPVPPEYPVGKYAVLFDPLDGSSNIDVNAAVGTIFSIYRRVSMEGRGTVADVLQPGCKQVAAGYVMYGSSTMLVYTTGQGVHGFTLDPTIGEFLLSHPQDRDAPASGSTTASTRATSAAGTRAMQAAVRGLKGDDARRDEAQEQPLHRLAGGRLPPQPDRGRHLPLSGRHQESRRASCGCSTRRARWRSSPSRRRARRPTGSTASSTSCPTALHQRTPLVIGSRVDVGFVADTLRHAAARASGPVIQPAL